MPDRIIGALTRAVRHSSHGNGDPRAWPVVACYLALLATGAVIAAVTW